MWTKRQATVRSADVPGLMPRAFKAPVELHEKSDAVRLVGRRTKRGSDGSGFLQHDRGHSMAVLARHVAVRKGGEKRHVGEDGRPHAALAASDGLAERTSPVSKTSSKR